MKHYLKYFALVVVLVFAAFPTRAALAASTTAYVYVSTPGGIYGYTASSSGQLKAMEYSPYTNTQGTMVGSNKSYFITVDTGSIHAYVVAPGGRIASQTWVADTQTQSGSECGTIGGATLDHTGKYVYVLLEGSGNCAVYQTWEIDSIGGLTFKGVSADVSHGFPAETPLVIEGNSKFAFESPAAANYTSPGNGCNPYLNLLQPESSGTLNYIDSGATVTGPAPGSNGDQLLPVPWLMSDDPTDHIALAVFDVEGPACGIGGSVQLGSFTVNSHGDLTSTNTGGNMPTVPGGVSSLILSRTGTYLAVATGPGVELFHFNGAKPITEFTGIIGTSGYVSHMSWDTANQLFALNGSSGKLHVYEVTGSGAKEASGSPILPPGGATNLVVTSE